MLSTLVAAWRNLIKRVAVDWLILTAALVTILLAMTLLAAGPIYADAVTESGLRVSLANAPAPSTAVVVETRVRPETYQQADRLVSDALERRLQGVEATVTRALESESLELPDQPEDGPVRLAVARSIEDLADHASLVTGEWPAEATSPFPVAVSSAAADELGVEVGERITTIDRRDRSRTVELEVVGIYRVDDAADPFWLEDRLILDGFVENGGFRIIGPLVSDQNAMLAGLAERPAAIWRAHLDFSSLDLGGAPALRGRVAGLGASLNQAPPPGASDFRVTTNLATLLAGTDRSLTVTRSSTLALLIQLAMLAGYALALTAGLLIDTRRSETGLLRARGASPTQILAISVLEALLLTVPAALAAPWLAAETLDLLGRYGPLRALGIGIDPGVTPESRLLVVLAALAAILTLAWPAWRSARNQLAARRREGRQSARSGAQRAGVDLALLGLALLAFWQLQSLGPQVATRVQGRFGVDPVLIAAPALGLLAGAVLALRIVPLLARIGERISGSGRRAVPALSAWQVARRPVRHARSALLLILAIGIGFFAASYSTTWVQSQQDQADYQVGADVRVSPNRRTGDSVPDLQLIVAHESVPGVSESMPLVRFGGTLPGADARGEYIMLDSGAARDVVQIRPDLAPTWVSLMDELRTARPTLPGVPIPGKPDLISLLIDANQVVPDDDGAQAHFNGTINLVLQDDDGLLHRIDLGPVEVNQGPQRLQAELTTPLDGVTLEPFFPLQVVDIEIDAPPLPAVRPITFDLISLAVADRGEDWENVTIAHDPAAWAQEVTSAGALASAPEISEAEEQPKEALRLIIEPAVGYELARVVFGIRPEPVSPLPQHYPVVVTNDWLASSDRQVGEELRLPAMGVGDARARIEGAIEAFPTVDPQTTPAVIADLATNQILRHRPGEDLSEIDEIWVSVSGDHAAVQSSLSRQPLESVRVVGRIERARSLATDPVALGTVGALTIGFLAAAIFAAVGFAVSATVSARERLTEFGLLRALGLSPRQLAAWMGAEQGMLVISSLGFGVLVGWVLTATILPLVSVTQEGARAMPEVTVVYPWRTVGLLLLGMVAVLGIIVAVMSLLLRRIGLGSLLRLGGDE